MANRSITDETFNEVYNFLNKNVNPRAAQGFKAAPNKLEWLNRHWNNLEEHELWTDKYKSIEDIVGNKLKTFPTLYEELNGQKPTEARFETIKKKYPWIVRKDLNEWFDKQNKYNQFYKDEAIKETNKNLREKEVEDWSLWKKLITSDYEKQRYINEPESAIFGEQAAGFAKSSPGAKADFISGVLAGGADLLPTKYALPVGPAIRFGRDMAHIGLDSPYKKDVVDAFTDLGKDAFLNATTYGLANTKQLARTASNLADDKVKDAYKLYEERNAIDKGIKMLDNSKADDITSLMAEINRLPQSSLKDDLIKEAGDWTQGINPNRMDKVIEDYRKALRPETEELYTMMINNPNYKPPSPNSYLKEKLLYNENPMKGIGNKIEYGTLRAINALNLGKPGYMGFSGVRSALGRGSKLEDKVQTNEMKQEFEDNVERVKNNYSLLWSTKRKPEHYDNPIVKEAYNRWLQEQQ
jgi:hypothetical protein